MVRGFGPGILTSLTLLVFASAGRAQLVSGSYLADRPSQQSPSAALTNSFGGAIYGKARAFGRTQGASVATAGPQPLYRGRALGRGATGPRAAGTHPGFRTRTSLLGGAQGGGDLYALGLTSRGAGQTLRMLSALSFNGYMPMQGLADAPIDRERNRFASWGSPEIVSRRSDGLVPQTQPAVSPDSPKVSLDELVKNSLESRRSVYLARAFEEFKAGDYHAARDQLMLADATAINAPRERVYVKLLFCFACLAAEQYVEAETALRWVLQRDYRDGGSAVPEALRQLRDVRSLYRDAKAYEAQMAMLERHLTRVEIRGTPSEALLRAIASWGGNDVANARYYARQAVDLAERAGVRDEDLSRLGIYLAAVEKSGESPQLESHKPAETSRRQVGTFESGLLTMEAIPVPPSK